MVDPRHPASKKLMWNIMNTFSTITVLVQQVAWNLKVKQHQNSVGSTHSSFTMSSSVPATGMWNFCICIKKLKIPLHIWKFIYLELQACNSKFQFIPELTSLLEYYDKSTASLTDLTMIIVNAWACAHPPLCNGMDFVFVLNTITTLPYYKSPLFEHAPFLWT